MKLSTVLIAFGILLILGAFVYAAVQLNIQNTGNVQTSANLTADRTTIDWGSLERGSNYTQTVTLTNTGTSTTQQLTMTSTCTIGTLTWDAEGLTVNSQFPLVITFSLTVSTSAPQGQFNFTILIVG